MPLVQPNGVVVSPTRVQLGAQHPWIVDDEQMGVFDFEVAEQRLDPGLVSRSSRPAEVLGDRAQRHELPGRPGGHLRAVVADGEQDRPVLVVDVDGHEPVDASLHAGEQPSAASASVNTISTWVEVSSADTMWAIHLRDTRSSTTVTAIPARMKCVVS